MGNWGVLKLLPVVQVLLPASVNPCLQSVTHITLHSFTSTVCFISKSPNARTVACVCVRIKAVSLFVLTCLVWCLTSQALRAEISDFLQLLRFEVARKAFNTAILQCEMHLRSNQAQVERSLLNFWQVLPLVDGFMPKRLFRFTNTDPFFLISVPSRRRCQRVT